MKTLVMTTIFVVTVVINAFGGNIQENFAYNEVMNGNQVESQIVYKVENGKFLQNHLKYNFIYDAQGRTIQKEALKWNEIEQAFERFYCLNYNYAYSDVKEKAVYLQAGDDINYLSYKWSKKDNDWNLLVEHATAEEDVLLLAVK